MRTIRVVILATLLSTSLSAAPSDDPVKHAAEKQRSSLVAVYTEVERETMVHLESVEERGAFWQKSEPSGPIVFEDIVETSGIDFVLDNSVTDHKYSIETMIGGVAVFDYDNDGHLDLYFPNGARIPDLDRLKLTLDHLDKSDPAYYNRLYRNKGDGTFTDVTQKAGVQGAAYSMGVAVGDYDNDGDVDLYVAGVDRNQLFRNNGDGTFADVTREAGVSGVHPTLGKTWAITAGWLDYENDGDLDLFLSNYLKWSFELDLDCKIRGYVTYCHPNVFEGLPNVLYRNNSDGTFTDVSEQAGISKHIGKGMGIAFADYDDDGFVDIFVSNDTMQNFLFHNDHGETFTEDSLFAGVAFVESGTSIAGMGAHFQDIDNDGRFDLFQTAMFYNTFPLYLNLDGTQFVDHTATAGLAAITRGFTAYGLGVFDFDNDGCKDLFAACGAILDNADEVKSLPFKMPNLVFRNRGDGTFDNVSASAGRSFQHPKAHRGAAFGDLDNDGRIDIVVTALNSRPELFLNRSQAANHWLIIDLVGTESNRNGLGARIEVESAGGAHQHGHAMTAVGYNSSSDKRVYFGLGAATQLERVEIRWPSGIRQVLTAVPADQVLTVREGNR